MARHETPAPVSKETPVNEVAIAQDFSAANTLALLTRETDARVRAVALQVGYLLPADCTDPDLIQRDISANMRRSVEACLEVGRGLVVLKAACGHGNFMARLDVLRIEPHVASRFVSVAKRFSNLPTSANLVNAIGNKSQLFEMMVLDDEQIEELELTGQTGELKLDDVAAMSVKELRAALRETRAEKDAVDKVLSGKDASMNKLRAQINRLQAAPPDEVLADMQRELAGFAAEAAGLLQGKLRQGLIALTDYCAEHQLSASHAMAGHVGQLQQQLHALRDEFSLPDIVGDGTPAWQQWAAQQDSLAAAEAGQPQDAGKATSAASSSKAAKSAASARGGA